MVFRMPALCQDWESTLSSFVPAADKALEPGQQLILNEFVNGIGDWCAAKHEGGDSGGAE